MNETFEFVQPQKRLFLFKHQQAAFSLDRDRKAGFARVQPGNQIHFQVWRSFARFDGRCSLRTWVYRVAHHAAASYVIRERRRFATLVSLEELEKLPDKDDAPDRQLNLERLDRLIQQLKPLDRQVIVSYLEDMDTASIAEITGLSPANVAMRIHRIKNVLARQFHERGTHGK